MRKEVITAVVFGLLLAFIITATINRASQVFKPKPATDPLATPTPNPTAGTEKGSESLTLHSPEDGLVQTEKTVVVTGTTEPNRPVVLLVNQVEEISNSDDSGNFSFTANLQDGGNQLEIIVLHDDGSSATERRTIIVGEFGQTATPSAAAEN